MVVVETVSHLARLLSRSPFVSGIQYDGKQKCSYGIFLGADVLALFVFVGKLNAWATPWRLFRCWRP